MVNRGSLALLSAALLISVASSSSLPLNPFATRLASLDDAISSFVKATVASNSTQRSFTTSDTCSSELSTFDQAKPSIATLNAKIQEYTDAFFAAQLERLLSRLNENLSNNSDREHHHKLRLDIENPATPMWDWKFHELCGSHDGQVCQAQLEFDLSIPLQDGKIARVSVETSSARCIPTRALTTCLAHSNLKPLQQELISSCEKLSHDGIEAKKCKVHAVCGPSIDHTFASKFGWIHWAVIGLITVVSLAIFVSMIRRIVRCVRNRRANKCGPQAQQQCVKGKVPSDDAEVGTPLVMMVQSPNGATYVTPYPFSH